MEKIMCGDDVCHLDNENLFFFYVMAETRLSSPNHFWFKKKIDIKSGNL